MLAKTAEQLGLDGVERIRPLHLVDPRRLLPDTQATGFRCRSRNAT
jgi:hypothetical protein